MVSEESIEDTTDMRIRDLPRDLLLLTVTMITANISSWMYLPFLPLYVKQLGASVVEVGVFFTTQVVIAICFRIFGGWVSDNIGRLPAIAMGSIFGWLGLVGFILVPSWEWALGVLVLRQVGVSFVKPSFRAFTAEHAPEGNMSSTFGAVQALFLICNIVGPLLGGFLIDHFGFRTMFIVASVFFGIATLMRIWLASRARLQWSIRGLQAQGLLRDTRGLIRAFAASSALLWLFAGDGLHDASRQLERSFGPVYATDVGGVSESAYGVFVSIAALTAALAMIYGGQFADRFGERWAIALGMGTLGVGWLLLTWLPMGIMFVLVYGMFGMARAFYEPAYSSLISKSVPKESLGMTWGVFMTALGVLAVPAPYIGGFLYDTISPYATTLLMAGLGLLAVPLAIWKLHTPHHPLAVDAQASHLKENVSQPSGAD